MPQRAAGSRPPARPAFFLHFYSRPTLPAPLPPWPAGIKQPKQQRYRNTKGVDPKFLRNQRYVTKGIRKVQTDKEAK